MQDTAKRLLDVLKETLAHQERIRDLMIRHKRLLIDAKDLDAQAVIEEIDERSKAVVACERDRQTIMAEIAKELGTTAIELTADDLCDLPISLSIREELISTTNRLREVLKEIVRLRDEIQVLAKHALAYSELLFNTLRDAVTQSNTYGKGVSVNGSFFSVRT
ncbi:flagellar export chaperone FlgN [Alicyclobacillus fastidiosus]|uniref:Flagellar export chaperone FlgN n=1 Tax=Alicyclobacillus fastidiosus TaxID=392011 RepID=A0ABV5AKT3_9BACL|nr:flagellar export chaperone FlgN [Alicyclobacillus fastidiosus]WEH10247.1 flagellar export chaperone FlgN [Alicyclobacillus fastidiosus]